jgi:glycine reductase
MAYRVVHYINNFFAGIGGEDMAHIPPEKRAGAVGPGLALQAGLGVDYEIIATLICGDNYFGERTEEALVQLLALIGEEKPHLLIAGPAFNAGRYGFACGSLAKAVEEKLHIPAFTAMFADNPGVETFRKDCYILKTAHSAAGMKNALPAMAAFAKKLLSGEEILGPEQEGYFERGIRVNYFHEKRGSERAIEMLLQLIGGKNPATEYPLPVYDRVEPVAPVTDIRHTKVAMITSGGIVPQGNPDRIESSSASKYGVYSIAGLQSMSKEDFTSIHGGYDRQYVLEDPNLVLPLDVMRELESEGEIGSLADYFISTTGTGTATGSAKRFGEEFSKKLLADGVGAVILTST